MKELLSNVGAGGAGPATGAPAAGGGGAAAGGDAPKEEEKKEEEKEESDDDMVRVPPVYPNSAVLKHTHAGLRSLRLILSNFCRSAVLILSFMPLHTTHGHRARGGPLRILRLSPCIHYTPLAHTKRF